MARPGICNLVILIIPLIAGQCGLLNAINPAKQNATNDSSPPAATESVPVSSSTIVQFFVKRVGNVSADLDFIVPTNSSTNSTDMDQSDSRARFRVIDPEHYRPRLRHHGHHDHYHHRHHHHHRHSQPVKTYSESYREPYQEVAGASDSEEIAKKEDPDYGHHYDSDGHHYDFGYDVKDKEGALTFRKESGDAKSLKGSYGIREPDGRLRIVRYVADEKGFRAKVETNEPGTGSEDAANVYFNGYDAEKIPSHDVVHKDLGQHSFKHGHYNSHSAGDSALDGEGTVSADESADDDTGRVSYHHDQIPMEINPTKEHRITVPIRPLAALMDQDDDNYSHDHYKNNLYNSYSSPIRFSPPLYRYPAGPIYAAYQPPKRRIGRIKYRKVPHLGFRIPYNTLTGFYRSSFF